MKTSVSTTITRLYGRAPQGERLIQKVLHGKLEDRYIYRSIA